MYKEKGLSKGQGRGIWWGLDSGTYILLSKPWRIVVERSCDAASDPRPRWAFSRLGRWSRALGALWSLARGPAETHCSSVMLMMGYFCYCTNLRHLQLDPLTLDRHPILADLPSPSLLLQFLLPCIGATNIHCSLPISSRPPPFSLTSLSWDFWGLQSVS